MSSVAIVSINGTNSKSNIEISPGKVIRKEESERLLTLPNCPRSELPHDSNYTYSEKESIKNSESDLKWITSNQCRTTVVSSSEENCLIKDAAIPSLAYFTPNASEKLFILLTSYFNVNAESFQTCHSVVNGLLFLLPRELINHPRNDFLFKIDSSCDDKINADLRDETIFNLRFLHKFYLTSSFVFADAVNIVDRFIIKVKVKPKYIACVATAAYYIALKRSVAEENRPSVEELVVMSRCGGGAKDLERMENIIRNKLGVDFEPVATSHMFLHAVSSLLSESELQSCLTILERSLCFATIYKHRPAALAISLLAQHISLPMLEKKDFSKCVHPVVHNIAEFCALPWVEVYACGQHVGQLNAAAVNKRPFSPKRLNWTLSKRTLSQLHRPAVHARTKMLPSICEDPQAWWEEHDDGLDLGQFFVLSS